MFDANRPPAYICTLTAEQEARTEPSAFGLMRITPQIRAAIDEAYAQLARGVPGEIEIPLELPLLPVRREPALAKSDVPNARALHTTLSMLSLFEDRRNCPVGDRMCQAFDRITTTRPANAVLIVGRQRAPRIRTGIRGGRTRYISQPIEQLAPRDWAFRPERAPLRLVATPEHHRA